MFPRNDQPLPQPATGGTFHRLPDGSLETVQETKPGLVRKPHPDMQQEPAAPAATDTNEE